MSTENMTDKLDLNVEDKRKLVEQLPVKTSFVNTLMKIHKKSEADAEMIFEKEALYYKKAVAASPEYLGKCTGISLYSALLEIAIQGLSIQPGQKSEAYLESRGVKTKVNGSDVWQQTAFLRITAYGELNMRIVSGQIIRMNNPIVLYDGDHFQPCTNQRGELIVDYKPLIPRKLPAKIIGAYVCIVLPNNGLDFKWLLEDDIQRLKKYSIPKGNQNGQANALYSSENGGIDPGFLEAKTIKHAMRAYTKLRVGDAISFDDELDEEELKAIHNTSTAQQTTPPEVVTVHTGADDDHF